MQIQIILSNLNLTVRVIISRNFVSLLQQQQFPAFKANKTENKRLHDLRIFYLFILLSIKSAIGESNVVIFILRRSADVNARM